MISNRAPTGYAETPDLAVVNVKGPGEDQASTVTIASVTMTRSALISTIGMLNLLLEEMRALETQEAVAIRLRANE